MILFIFISFNCAFSLCSCRFTTTSLKNISVYSGTTASFECQSKNFALTKDTSDTIAYANTSHFIIIENKADKINLVNLSSTQIQVQILMISQEDEGVYCCPNNDTDCIDLRLNDDPDINMTVLKDQIICYTTLNQTNYTLLLEHFSYSMTLLRSMNESAFNNANITMEANNLYQNDGIYRCKVFILDLDGKTSVLINEKEEVKRSDEVQCLNNIQPEQQTSDEVTFYLYGYNSSRTPPVFENGIFINDSNSGYRIKMRICREKLLVFGNRIDLNVTMVTIKILKLKEMRAPVSYTLKLEENTTCKVGFDYPQATKKNETGTDIMHVIEIYVLSCCGCVVFFWILTVISNKVNCRPTSEDER